MCGLEDRTIVLFKFIMALLEKKVERLPRMTAIGDLPVEVKLELEALRGFVSLCDSGLFLPLDWRSVIILSVP